ncbi:MAG TPA: hypothetical protein VF765_32540 [Polyangiaceae bacterium]
MLQGRARRVFVAVWILLGLAGALDHTIAENVLGSRIDLVLPHLKYGYVMFNINPRTVSVYEYAGADGVRHDLADLVATPAPGYARARVAIDAGFQPAYLAEICLRAWRATHQEYDFYVDTYEVEPGRSTLTNTSVHHCSPRGLRDAADAR